MSNMDTAAARAALDRLREAEAGMTPGEWCQSGYIDRIDDDYAIAIGGPPDRVIASWSGSGPGMGDEHASNAIGIALLRNAAPALIAVAVAAAAYRRAESEAADYASASEGNFNVWELERPVTEAGMKLDAALAALAATAPAQPDAAAGAGAGTEGE